MSSIAEYGKLYRQRLKAEGRCLNHPSEFRPCQKCKEWRNERNAALRAQGRCSCGLMARPNRRTCAECGEKAVEKNRREGLAELAQGRCRLGCGRSIVPPHTLCDYHLEQLRTRARVRGEQRRALGLCRQCGRPSEFGQIFCLIHRRSQKGLPQPVRAGLRQLRKTQDEAEKNHNALAAREFIDQYIHLITNERTRAILKMRYGHTAAECRTLEDVGAKFGITGERVRQIQQLAEDRIRMYAIEKDIPLPTRHSGKAGELRETLAAMEVGDSFVMPDTDFTRSGVREIAKAMGMLITTRKVQNGRRVWMVNKNANTKNKIHAAA